ncbi:hypothetical protein EJB05_39977, partial [Eragrostis curvula]
MGRSGDVLFVSSGVKLPSAAASAPSTERAPETAFLPLAYIGAAIGAAARRVAVSFPRAPIARADTGLSPPREHGKVGGGEARLLISEVAVRGKGGQPLDHPDLEAAAADALRTCRPNEALTAREVLEDVRRFEKSGFFRSCTPVAVDTGNGIRLVLEVEPNHFHGLVCEGANMLPSKFLEDSFRDCYGKPTNMRHLDQVIKSVHGWYQERGLAGSVSGTKILCGGVIRLQVSEVEVNNINLHFLLDRKTGEPAIGKTHPETILREFTTKKEQAYNRAQVERDVRTIFAMGILKDCPTIVEQPVGDSNKVDLVMNVVEGRSYDFSGGVNPSSGIYHGFLSGLIGSISYSLGNVFRRNKKLNLSLEKGQIDSTFQFNFTDPYIDGDNKRTSRTVMVQNSRTPGTLVHGVDHLNHEHLTIGRITAGVEYNQPFRPKWRGALGLFFQHAGACDDAGNIVTTDFYNSQLTASGNACDNTLLAKAESVYTDSGDHSSTMFAFSVEQGLPILPEWLSYNRVTAHLRQGYEIGPARLLLRASGGHVEGNFPPHEAFSIGGTNSVRGYEEGAIGSGRSYAVGCGEVSWHMFGPVEGVVFADYGSDFDSGHTVPGNPAGVRGKPGSGYGYGVGIHVDSPLGPLRLEYAFNDQQAGQFHFGLGCRN